MAKKIKSETVELKPIKEVITKETVVMKEVTESKGLKLKDNEDITVLKKYQKELKIEYFETTDGRIF
jgi:hypothetical protein